MSRFIDPAPEYKPNSKMYFFKSGTNSPLITYKDQFETIANTHPVPTDSSGVVPNIFFSGSARLKVLDENNVQYISRDPVGGEKELGEFNLWDSVATYDKNDIVEGSDGKFYISLSNGNIANDPTTSPTLWSEIEFLGSWNTNVIYSVGVVVKTSTGNLWKALTATAGNDPETDNGTNWLPAIDGAKVPEVIALEGLNVWSDPEASNFTAIAKKPYQIDGSIGAVDITIPVIAIGDPFTFHNLITSTFKVQILNPSYTIKGNGGDIPPDTDLELVPGDSVQLVAKTTLILSIVGAQV